MRVQKRVLGALCVAAVLSSVVVIEMAADGRFDVRLRDDCDPATFNAVLGPGVCVGNGNTTFDEFQAELADKREVGAWKNDPDATHVSPRAIAAFNEGGEPHTFTEVTDFGGGYVADLNERSGNPVAAAECADTAADGSLTPTSQAVATRAKAGDVVTTGPLAPGLHRFQCCIHPWMRTEVTVRTR